MKYLLTFHGKNGCANAPYCNVYTYIVCLVKFRISLKTFEFRNSQSLSRYMRNMKRRHRKETAHVIVNQNITYNYM